jgi:hypothetical protein
VFLVFSFSILCATLPFLSSLDLGRGTQKENRKRKRIKFLSLRGIPAMVATVGHAQSYISRNRERNKDRTRK